MEAADEAAGEATPGQKLIPKDNRGFEGFLFFGFIYLESRVDGFQMAPPSQAASINTALCLSAFSRELASLFVLCKYYSVRRAAVSSPSL